MTASACMISKGIDKDVAKRIADLYDTELKTKSREEAKKAIIEIQNSKANLKKRQAEIKAIRESVNTSAQDAYRSIGNREDRYGFVISMLENNGNLRGNPLDVASHMDAIEKEDFAPLFGWLKTQERGWIGHKARLRDPAKIKARDELIANVGEGKKHRSVLTSIVQRVEARLMGNGVDIMVRYGDTVPYAINPQRFKAVTIDDQKVKNKFIDDAWEAINAGNGTLDLYVHPRTQVQMTEVEIKEYLGKAFDNLVVTPTGTLRKGSRGASYDNWSVPIRDPDAWKKFNDLYGEDDTTGGIIEYIRRASNMGAITNIMGPEPQKMRKFLLDRAEELHSGAKVSGIHAMNPLVEKARRAYAKFYGKNQLTSDGVRQRDIIMKTDELNQIGEMIPGAAKKTKALVRAYRDLDATLVKIRNSHNFVDNMDNNFADLKAVDPKMHKEWEKAVNDVNKLYKDVKDSIELDSQVDRAVARELLDKQIQKLDMMIANPLEKGYTDASRKHIDRMSDVMLDMMMGEMDSTSSSLNRAINQNIRNLATAGMLGTSFWSSMTDQVTMKHALHSMGIQNALQKQGLDVVKEMTNASDEQLARIGYISQLYTETSTTNARFIGELDAKSKTGLAAERIVALSGMVKLTEANKRVFHLEVAGAIAELTKTKFDDLPDKFKETLQMSNIKKADWEKIADRDILERHGKATFMSIPNIRAKHGDDIADKLGAMMQRWQKKAIIEPGYYEKALLQGRQKQGSDAAEIMKTVTGFKSHPLTVTMRAMERLAQRSFQGQGGQAMAGLVGYIAALTAMGAVVIQATEMLKGYGPRDMTSEEHATGFWLDALMKGGGVGIIGDLMKTGMEEAKFGQGQAEILLGPGIGLIGAGKSLFEGNVDKFRKQITGYIPGQNLWQTRYVFHEMFMEKMRQMEDPVKYEKRRRRRIKWRKDNYGNEPLFEGMF